MLQASQAVHTTGVNFESIGVIVACIAVMLTIMGMYIARRDHAQEKIKTEIADAINHQTEVLLAKLETKETVSRISERLTSVETAMKDIRR